MAVAILGHSLLAILGFGLSSSAFAFWSLVEPSVVFGRLPSAFGLQLSDAGLNAWGACRWLSNFGHPYSPLASGLWYLGVGHQISG